MSNQTKRVATPQTAFNRASGRYESRLAVRKAILSGELAHPTTLSCVDCGMRASEYEHRDYGRPLDVVPICGPCNTKRGRGADHPETEARLSQYQIEYETRWRERVSPPALAPFDLVMKCKTYTEAVRLCWDLRFYPTMTMASVCERIGVRQTHISDMLSPDGAPRKRELPAKKINDFEWAVGNRAITQYMLLESRILLDLPLMRSLMRELDVYERSSS
jgi:hypothetical protein